VVLRDPVAAVLPEDHPLAGREEIALADLAGRAVGLDAARSWPPWHRKYDEDFARAGFRARVVQRGSNPALGLLREVVHDVARTTDLTAAG
jgi:DNA-binding transcriptional LysR family regulator